LFLEYRRGFRGELSDSHFDAAIIVRSGYPIITHRVKDNQCAICNLPCGRSAAHILACNGQGIPAGRTIRHTHVQDEVLVVVKSAKSPSVHVNSGAPDYSDYFTKKVVTANETNADAPNRFADACITINGDDYLLDFNVSGPAQTVLAQAILSTGAMAKSGEDRKTRLVRAQYHVPDSKLHTLVPFALDATGTFGSRATKFLKTIVNSIPISGDDDDGDNELVVDDHDGGANEFAGARSSILWRFKESIVAVVLRKNASILRNYLRKMGASASDG
jgi:hypothetical protein